MIDFIFSLFDYFSNSSVRESKKPEAPARPPGEFDISIDEWMAPGVRTDDEEKMDRGEG